MPNLPTVRTAEEQTPSAAILAGPLTQDNTDAIHARILSENELDYKSGL